MANSIKTENKISRKKQSRRKILKTMAVSGGAVVAAKSIPEQWSKPILDSVVLPAHGQMSAPSVCEVVGSVAVQTITGGDAPIIDNFGPYTIPGTYSEIISGSGTTAVTPTISVTPGITDSFNLTSVVSQDVVNGADLNQNVMPDPVNGAIAFNTIGVDTVFFDITMTLTPDNSAFCGAAQVINIDFND